MGIYFIAAGKSSKNRERTLDISHSTAEISDFLSTYDLEKLKIDFPSGKGIYIWGANEGSYNHLSSVKRGEYVVDIKNNEVVQVFIYCYFFKTKDTKLQEFLGWDSEKPEKERRPYNFVYFLKSPHSTWIKEKSYFQKAFYVGKYWMKGQRYFTNEDVNEACRLTKSKTIEAFLGIVGTVSQIEKQKTSLSGNMPTGTIRRKVSALSKNRDQVDWRFDDWLNELKKYKKEISRDLDDINNKEALQWLKNQKYKFKNNKLSLKQVDLLISNGVELETPLLDDKWMECYNAVKDFQEMGINELPKYINNEASLLYQWYLLNFVYYKKGLLDTEKDKLFNCLKIKP